MNDIHFCLDNSPQFQMLELEEVTSTNDFLRDYHPIREQEITLVTAEYQTTGRGAGDNHWESDKGENLLFSLLVHPRHIAAPEMFLLSEVLALAVKDGLEENGKGTAFSIKWPNDIYYKNQKICGLLIENELQGKTIERCIMGVGVNVNQTRFHSDAPNPVSLAQILGMQVERRFVLEDIMKHFTRYYAWTKEGRNEELHQMYLAHLYRKGETHRFQDKTGVFCGTIVTVEPTGHLIIRDEEGEQRRYTFKEVEYLGK
ncbi:MAG: biotin--[acetyl-CoA-carboxylase] ligase [Bacteroidaceae bacterium]|nr:biotin--[acetyl-CoA-carboxylase] ligase [Bacteroidaceae bacterium]